MYYSGYQYLTISIMLITYQATLLEKTEIAPEVFLLKFSYPDQAEWTYKAGQYMIFHIPKEEKGHPARRLYSIASSPVEKDHLGFVIEIIPDGLGSTFAKDLPVGEKATLQGPAGLFTYKESDKDSIFLATGTGIAPIYSMVKTLLETNSVNGKQLKLFWGMKFKKDLYLMKELIELAEKHDAFTMKVCLSREEQTDVPHCMIGRVTHGLEEMEEETMSNYDYYICGGPKVVESLKEYLASKNIPANQVHFEKFT